MERMRDLQIKKKSASLPRREEGYEVDKSSGGLRHQSEPVAPPPPPLSNSSKQTGRCLLRCFVSLIPRLGSCICERFSLSSVLKRTHIRKILSQLDTVNQIRNLLQP